MQMFPPDRRFAGVAALGALFANQLAANTAAIGYAEGTADYAAESLAALPAAGQLAMLEAYAAALHPIFWVGAVAAVLASLLGWLLVEVPLSDGRAAEPSAAE